MAHYTLLPAYGRDYKTARDARNDFEAGMDFEDASYDASGRYVNAPQLPQGARVVIRFARAAKLTTFVVGSAVPRPRARARGIPRVREYLVTCRTFLPDHCRRVTLRVLAPTPTLAALNLGTGAFEASARFRLGLVRVESVAAARKEIGQRARVALESVRVPRLNGTGMIIGERAETVPERDSRESAFDARLPRHSTTD